MASSLMLISFLCSLSLPCISHALSGCGGPCRTQDDCYGQLICINSKCDDDPDVGTHICGGGSGGGSSCGPSGTLRCGSRKYPTYTWSPPVTSFTPATLTNNNFEEGGDGGEPSEYDGMYHSNSELIVALSTGWYDHGSRCGKFIRITANGRSENTKVVDECDSVYGCDVEHAGQPPCKQNIVDASKAVWDALGLNANVGVSPITWIMA